LYTAWVGAPSSGAQGKIETLAVNTISAWLRFEWDLYKGNP
jgi:hypothetical protein